LVRERDTLTAAKLCTATGKSQSSVSLALQALNDRICKIGAARSTRYGLRKPILDLQATQPLLLINKGGETERFGALSQLSNGAIHVRASAVFNDAEWLTAPNKLPWFLAPIRPQGFLGRALRVLRPDFANDPDAWSVEQALYMEVLYDEPTGAFTLGTLKDRLLAELPIDMANRALRYAHYDGLTAQIGNTLPTRSSAGGEQPKFITSFATPEKYKHVIVKFSPPRGIPFGERWHALLHLEHLAHQVLGEQGVAVAETSIVESATRTYLESTRFDRIGLVGMRHVVAIDAIDREWNSARRENWVMNAAAIRDKGLIDSDSVSTIARIFAFGQYIGNTDMHFGNLSFYVDDVVTPRICLAPVHDMLPMMWRPDIHSSGLDLTPVRLQPQVAGHAVAYAEALKWARIFWQRAAALPSLDGPMRLACATNLERL
jgi:HipA-like C-terminal domain